MYRLAPRDIIDLARKLECLCIVFTVNEPTVSIPSLLDVSREAREADIPMGCLTNGYMTEESTEVLAAIFSFFNISLKGLSRHFIQEYIGIPNSMPVLRNIERLARDRHVEVTTPIIEGGNDNEIDQIADFLEGVDPEMPWHVFRLLPEDEMRNSDYPDIISINKALTSAKNRLHNLYFHNFVGSEWVDTVCPECGAILVERLSLGCGGDKLKRLRCNDDGCPNCGRPVRMMGKFG